MKRDYFYTTLAFGINTAASLLFYYLLGNFFSDELFENIILTKRIGSSLLVLLILGLGVSLSRQVALCNEDEISRQYKLLGAAFTTILLISIPILISIVLFDNTFALLFFNDILYAHLILPLSLIVIGQLVNSIVLAFLRGRSLITRSNLLTIINALTPIVSLFITNSAKEYLQVLSVLYILSSLTILSLSIPIVDFILNLKVKSLIEEMKELLGIGVPRIPGDFSLEAMFTVPIMFTSHFNGTWEASMLAFSFTVFTMIVSMIAPISFVLLPYSAKYIKEKNTKFLKRHIVKLLSLAIIFTFVLATSIQFLSGNIIQLFLRSEMSGLSAYFLKIVVWACIPYSIYLIIRSFIDTAYKKAINAINVTIGLAILCIVSFASKFIFDLQYPALTGILIGFLTIGYLTLKSFTNYFKFSRQSIKK